MAGPRVNEETLRRVADAYQAAASNGLPPAKAVEAVLSLPASTATRYIARARAAGLLAPPDHLVHRRVKAVADAVGVEYSTLYDAIVTHADGDLRIVRS